MYGAAIRLSMKLSILKRVGALAAIATVGGALIAVAPATAQPPRPGKSPCTLNTSRGTMSFADGSEIEVPIRYPSGHTGTVTYRCDDGKWVHAAQTALRNSPNSAPVTTSRLAAISDSPNARLVLTLPANRAGLILDTGSVAASHTAR
jgi:hypothetical protein